MKRQAWPQAAAAFDAARVCNEKDALARQSAMATLEANAAIDPEFRTNQVAVMRTFIDRARHEQYAAALNSANFFYQSGDVDKARELLDVAELDPALTTEVASLRLLVPKVPGASRPPAEP